MFVYSVYSSQAVRLFHPNHHTILPGTTPASAPFSCFCSANGSQSNEYQLHVRRTDVASLTDALGYGFSLLYYIFLIHTSTNRTSAGHKITYDSSRTVVMTV